jgi:hypothetical protein
LSKIKDTVMLQKDSKSAYQALIGGKNVNKWKINIIKF